MKISWFQVALINFLLAAILGLTMRLAFVTELPGVEYRNVMHAHSHVAMLGWIYLALYALLIHYFIPDKGKDRFYRVLFWITQVSVAGMLFSFPFQGYGAISIAFSTLHVVCSIIFAWRFFEDLAKAPGLDVLSTLFVRTALTFMVLSNIALLAMPPIMISGMKQTALYYAAIQFFLHFQFNGFYLFSLLAIFYKWVTDHGFIVQVRSGMTFYILLTLSCFLTYLLAVTWSTPLPWLFWVNSLGVILQLLALAWFVKTWRAHLDWFRSKLKRWSAIFLAIAFISFAVKILIQGVVVVPAIAVITYTIRNFVIGFIHLILLGAASSGIFAFALEAGWLRPVGKKLNVGFIIFLSGILLSELILFLQGSMFWAGLGFLPHYYLMLFLVSGLLPIGIAIIILSSGKTISIAHD